MTLKVLSFICLVLLLPNASYSKDYIHGKVIKIADGDTLTILTKAKKQIKIRLIEIDAPEKKQPWGQRAKQALADKVFGKEVKVVNHGEDRYHRVLGRVWLEDSDINRDMVREGHAWVYTKYNEDKSLLFDEVQARGEKVGLWSLPEHEQIKPWEWRQKY